MRIKTYEDVEFMAVSSWANHSAEVASAELAETNDEMEALRRKWEAKIEPFAFKPPADYSMWDEVRTEWFRSEAYDKHDELSEKMKSQLRPYDDLVESLEAQIKQFRKEARSAFRAKDPRHYALDPSVKNGKRPLENPVRVPESQIKHARSEGSTECIEVAPQWFFFHGMLHHTNDRRLTADDVVALIMESENKRRLKLEKAHAVKAMVENLDNVEKRLSRQPIPQPVRIEVWQRDSGRCVECGSQGDLEFDHIIPFSLGGANTARNLQLLCMSCNRSKGATLG